MEIGEIIQPGRRVVQVKMMSEIWRNASFEFYLADSMQESTFTLASPYAMECLDYEYLGFSSVVRTG
jgi:hypothetical protein